LIVRRRNLGRLPLPERAPPELESEAAARTVLLAIIAVGLGALLLDLIISGL